MIYTNNYNLPDAILKVIIKDNYKRGKDGYSVTELINSPRIVHLQRRYDAELVEDAMDSIWSVFGSAVHHLMETHASDGDFAEQRYYITHRERTIGGMIDAYNHGTITDYKVTSAYSIVYKSKIKGWTEQLNLYGYILRQNGIEVNRLHIAAFLRDWDRNKARAQADYPKTPFIVVPIELWSDEQCLEFIDERVMMLIACETLSDEDLIECTKEEMWVRDSTWAVMKEGRKSAVRLFSEEDDAVCFMDQAQDDKQYLVERKGQPTRCIDYCSCNSKCSIYQDYLKEVNING